MDAGPNTRTAIQVRPNVTPMIDVMLVLLVIFMVVGPVMFNQCLLPVPPRASNIAVYPYQHTDVTLWIDRDGNYYLNKHPIRASVVQPQLSRIFASRPDDRVLYLLADRGVDYGVVHTALDIAARSGARVVGLVSEPRAATEQRR